MNTLGDSGSRRVGGPAWGDHFIIAFFNLLPMNETTSNGIQFEWWITGPDGAHFALFPVRGTHTAQDIADAKAELRRNRDVVSIRVIWQPA